MRKAKRGTMDFLVWGPYPAVGMAITAVAAWYLLFGRQSKPSSTVHKIGRFEVDLTKHSDGVHWRVIFPSVMPGFDGLLAKGVKPDEEQALAAAREFIDTLPEEP